MRRRDLLPTLAGAALWACRAPQPALPDSRHLVSTPELRATYLQKMLIALCTELGPRLACTPACEAGARLIAEEMRKALPLVELDTFSITGWELMGNQELRIGNQEVEAYLAQYGPGTPPEGITGVLAKDGEHYRIVDQATGKPLANLDLGQFGPAVASSYRATDGVPRFGIGQAEIPLLERALRQQTPVFARAAVRHVPGCQTSNVVGTLPGLSNDEVMFIAHADTVYSSPGASDNTATLIAMLMLAHGLSGQRRRRTLRFVASTAEEGGSWGAQNYAAVRKKAGTLHRVKFCVNLDSLTYGPHWQVTTTDAGLKEMILAIHRDLAVAATPNLIHRDDTMDSAPFGAAGARTVHLNSRGHNERTLPLNHRWDDTAHTIDPELVETSYRLLMEFASRLDSA